MPFLIVLDIFAALLADKRDEVSAVLLAVGVRGGDEALLITLGSTSVFNRWAESAKQDIENPIKQMPANTFRQVSDGACDWPS